MLKMFTCDQGHAWEAALAEGSDQPPCPECGLPPDLGPQLQSEAAEVSPLPVNAPPAPPVLLDDSGLPVVPGYDNLHDLGRTAGGVRQYRARQQVAGRTVLLQVVLAREDSSQRAWNYLRGEASAHGKLSHPNIVAIHEIGERHRLLFFNAMEFVEGPTLAELAGDAVLPIHQVVALMELLARAIAHAGERNIMHRHLEPALVGLHKIPTPKSALAKASPGGGVCRLLDGYYIPKIRGFGLARRPTEGDTIDSDLFLEAGYISPEQAWGRVNHLGPPTDVYGLGGILYFLLSGRMPFRGPTLIDIIDAVQTAPLVAPTGLRRVPQALLFVCKKALARQTRRRYLDAEEMADDLRRVAQYLPLPTRSTSTMRRLGAWCRRRPAAAALWLVVPLALLGWVIAFASGEGEGRIPGRERVLQS